MILPSPPPAPPPEAKALFDALTVLESEYARRLGVGLRYPGGPDDLLHDFYVDRLPVLGLRLLELPLEARTRVFRAALRNYAIDNVRREVRHEKAIQVWSEEVMDRASRPSIPLTDNDLEGALEALPGLEREIVERSFGIGHASDSERALGRELRLDRREVRRRLIDGLVRLTLQLSERARLTPRQIAVARMVLEGGCSLADAAERMGITTQDARKALAEARREMEMIL